MSRHRVHQSQGTQVQAERRAERFIKANVGTLSRIGENMPKQEQARLEGLLDRAIRYGWNAAVRAVDRDRQKGESPSRSSKDGR